MSIIQQVRNFRYFEVRGDQAETLDKIKGSATSITGILLTDYGALFGVGGRVTWGAIGRFLMCGMAGVDLQLLICDLFLATGSFAGGGFLSMFWFSERLIWKGYKKAGFELGMGMHSRAQFGFMKFCFV
jgi:hypothetical protein